MLLVSVISEIGHNKFWDYNIRDPLGKVHFKRPTALAPGEKIKESRSTAMGGGVNQCLMERGDCLCALFTNTKMANNHMRWPKVTHGVGDGW